MTNRKPPYLSHRKSGWVLEPRGERRKQLGKATIRLSATTQAAAYAEAWAMLDTAENSTAHARLFATEAISWHESLNSAHSTIKSRLSCVRFWVSIFPKTTLQEITTHAIHNALKASGHAPTYQKTLLATLRAFFAAQIEAGNATINPASAVKPPKTPPTITPHPKRTIDALIAQAEAMGMSGVADAIFIAVRTGFRRVDILNLRHADIGATRISITQQKTGQPHAMPLTPPVKARLQAIKQRSPGQAHIILDPDQRPYSIALFDKHWDKVRRAAGHDHVKFKDLRDTFSHALQEAGADEKQIASGLGHSPNSKAVRHYINPKPAKFADFLPQD